MSAIKKNMLSACLVALGLVLGYIENLIPAFIPLYGLKIGFSNLVVLYALFEMNGKQAFVIGILKSFLSGVLFSGLMSIAYSLPAILLATLGMRCIKNRKEFSEIGVSAVGSALFQVGQISAACVVLASFAPIYYLPYLLIGSVFCGILSGFLVGLVRKNISGFNRGTK